ncbi:MAG: PD40 domain-containing protein [Ardenticatenales bacterium]|nr:PD40 domain-containing protein [Ardenticatenales bacterium]
MVPTDYIDVEPPVSTQRYWTGVALFIGALLIAIAAVLFQGSHATVRARRLLPAPDSSVSVYPTIRVLFTRPLDKSTVEGAVVIEPAVPFDIAWSENELRLLPRVPLQAGNSYKITIGPGVRDATGVELEGTLEWQFSTREPQVAFIRPGADGNGELWIATRDGQGGHRLSAPGQSVQDFDASSDGSMVAYSVSEGPSTVNLWRAEPERGGLTRLTNGSNILYSAPRFSPAGDLLVVEVRQIVTVGDQGDVLSPPSLELRRPLDGSPAGQVYGKEQEIGHSPRWSPTGTHLAFYEANSGSVGVFNFTSDVLFFPGESAYLGEQTWSPDSRALVYTIVNPTSEGGAQQMLVVRDLQLGTESIHGERIGDQADPAWSPDGALIAYAYRPPPGADIGAGIWVMRPDGTGKVLLVSEPGVIYSQPLWSPDGEWLQFGRFNPSDTEATQSLWVIRRDGTEPHRVSEVGFQHGWVP